MNNYKLPVSRILCFGLDVLAWGDSVEWILESTGGDTGRPMDIEKRAEK